MNNSFHCERHSSSLNMAHTDAIKLGLILVQQQKGTPQFLIISQCTMP